MYRDIRTGLGEQPLHFGGRALGRFLPDNESWLEVSYLAGRRAGRELSAWAIDLGTTWSPSWAGRVALTGGYAYGSGGGRQSGRDGTFRQTGFQDNNARFAGVTSFRYYGELFDPELTNLHIATLGIGARLWDRTSLDLVLHHYRQDVAVGEIVDAEVDDDPDGIHRDLGFEADLIFGARRWRAYDIEVVGAYFRPGTAFEHRDDAFLGRLQLRYRF